MKLECLASVQVVPRLRRKADQVVDLISLGDVVDSGKVEMNALMKFDLQPERRTTEIQFVVRLHHKPKCAVPGIGAGRQAVQLRTPDPKVCAHDSELIDFVASEPESPLEVSIDPTQFGLFAQISARNNCVL